MVGDWLGDWLVLNMCICGFLLKPWWSPIRKLVASADTGTQNTFMAEARHRDTPNLKILLHI